MKMIKKAVVLAAAVFMSSSVFAFNWEDFVGLPDQYKETVKTVNSGMADFSKQLAIAVPQAATQQNVWADAYIGQLFPSVPPHIGGGFNMGLTHIDTSGIAKAAKELNIKNVKDDYYYPVFTADIRFGGVLLPFDFDIAVMKTGKISTDKIPGANLDVDFFTIGADFRYALLEGGLVMPKLSVGLGYFYNQGSFGCDSSYAKANVDYKIQTMYVQAQLSKQILMFTPFVGLRGLVSKHENDWSWALKEQTAVEALTLAGMASGGSGTEKSDMFDFNAIQPQIFAGIGVSFLVLDVNLSLTADLRNIKDKGLWSGAASVRLSL